MRIHYTEFTDQERLDGILTGDPVGDYKGFPEVQKAILEEEVQCYEVLGSKTDDEPLTRDDEFVICNLNLALKLHYTVGMQELRRGAGKPNPKNLVTKDTQVTIIDIVRNADLLLLSQIEAMTVAEREKTAQSLLSWTNGIPPLGSDFSDADRLIIESFEDSPLVSLYTEFLPE